MRPRINRHRRASRALALAILAGTVAPLALTDAARAAPPPGSKAQIAVFRPSTGMWYSQSGPAVGPFGVAGDLPATGDYDGNGTPDPAVFRPSTGMWYIANVATPVGPFGAPGDRPAVGDYNGDGRTEIAVFRPSNATWYFQSGSAPIGPWGAPGDLPAVGDYNGDGKDEIAVFRPSTATWYSQFAAAPIGPWGAPGDLPAVGDYNGDGKDEIAVFRPSTATWYSQFAAAPIGPWGAPGDLPAASWVAPSVPAATTSASRMLTTALAEVGTAEGTARANAYFTGAGLGSYDSAKEPWCAAFVSWVAQQARAGTSLRSASVGAWVTAAKNRTHNLTITTTPGPGDIVVFDWGATKTLWDKDDRHIGIVRTAPNASGAFTTVEGNTSMPDRQDGVAIRDRQLGGKVTTMFIRVTK